jgi:hypothetical protein
VRIRTSNTLRNDLGSARPPPVERNPVTHAYQSEPDEVAPLWRRPLVLVSPVLAIVLAVVIVPALWDRVRPAPIAVGSCVSDMGTVVDCSRGSAIYVITDKVASVEECPPQKFDRGRAFGNDNFVLCVVPKPLPLPAP